jgi:hypothetical protein
LTKKQIKKVARNKKGEKGENSNGKEKKENENEKIKITTFKGVSVRDEIEILSENRQWFFTLKKQLCPN